MAVIKKTRYVAQKLTKYFPKKYPTYTSALPQARIIYGRLQKTGDKVILKNIFPQVRKPRKKRKKGEPVLPSAMSEPTNFFYLQDYPGYISKLPDNLVFTSGLFPAKVKQPIIGGGNYDYEDLFAPFVNYINDMITLADDDEGSERNDYYVRCTTPVPDKKKKGQWTSEIISTDANGDEFDYGFDPKKPSTGAKAVYFAESEPPKKEVAPPPPEVSETKALLELEKAKQVTIEKKMEYIKQLKGLGFTPAEIKKELAKL